MYLIVRRARPAAGADPAGHRRRPLAPPAGIAIGLAPPRGRFRPWSGTSTRDLMGTWERLLSSARGRSTPRSSRSGRTRSSATRSARASIVTARRSGRDAARRASRPCCRCSSSCPTWRSTSGPPTAPTSPGRRREGARREVRTLLALRASSEDANPTGRASVRSVRRALCRLKPDATAPLKPEAAAPSRSTADVAATRSLEIWIAVLIVVVDQVSKAIVRSQLELHDEHHR